MAWVDLARNNLLAAKRMCKSHPRSCISRAYYAAHVLVTDALIKAGYVPMPPYETAPHKQQAILIGLHLMIEGPVFVADLSQAISRLYKSRLMPIIHNSHESILPRLKKPYVMRLRYSGC
jgi:hypothetical protein